MRRAAGILAALAALLAPALAAACPQCASQQNGGILRSIVLGAFVLLPWVVVALVIRYVRSGERDERPPLRPARALAPRGKHPSYRPG